MNDLHRALGWRYATKKFDPQRKLDESQLHDLLEIYRLSASSYGLQAGKLLVIEDPALREQLKPHAWNQSQITEASHLFVLCHRTALTPEDVDAYMQLAASTRGVDAASLEGFGGMIKQSIAGMSPEHQAVWHSRQVYIALGKLLMGCALMGIDACPMEGFVPAEFNRILELDKQNLSAVVLLPVGYRHTEDAYASAPKVRKPLDQLVERR